VPGPADLVAVDQVLELQPAADLVAVDQVRAALVPGTVARVTWCATWWPSTWWPWTWCLVPGPAALVAADLVPGPWAAPPGARALVPAGPPRGPGDQKTGRVAGCAGLGPVLRGQFHVKHF